MDSYFEIFRSNIKFYRDVKGYSQSELAIQTDVTNGLIGQIESGRTKPSFDTIVKIASALGVHPADLFLRNASVGREKINQAMKKILEKEIPLLIEKELSSI
ncbi:MAG: helix-turn-helix transcriptional regulator [Treponema sp.]|nr:helix-turn-helix domain-containing protein [Spirochaetia bacterium]MDD7580087.1 helix-turn-helix transcriptional regulator [Treponema sp.]MDY3758936.1 helix-turn-helix transcriptional regulator [Treponema sp.]MDY4130768.1 helix-turn-helix transcriptional regulator [Treponema sp.]MDY5837425.1 helix-turn-helix transcriptional regulator [Treponema sp.]